MAVPVQTYINISKVCQYLAADGSARNVLFKGNNARPNQSRLIYMVRKAVEWLFNLNPDDELLSQQANYLYSLCNPYVAEANRIINAGTTGNIVDPNTGQDVTIQTPNPQFRVGDPGALMTAGETELTLGYSGVVNPSLEITLDGVEIPYGDPNVFSFTATYNANDVVIVFNAPVQDGQLFNIHLIRLVPV